MTVDKISDRKGLTFVKVRTIAQGLCNGFVVDALTLLHSFQRVTTLNLNDAGT